MENKPFEPSPHLSDEINKRISESELQGGCFLDKLPLRTMLLVTTENTTYQIEKISDNTQRIKGNARYCPEWSNCNIHGSTWGTSMLKMGFIGRGMHLEVFIEGVGIITTSTIQEVEIYRQNDEKEKV